MITPIAGFKRESVRAQTVGVMLLLPFVLGRNDCRCGEEEIIDDEDSSAANGNHVHQPAWLLAALAR
jgi:hypothetical protein